MPIQQVEVSNPEYMSDPDLMLLTVHSSALQRRGNVHVYNAYSSAKDLPIIFLLHGVYGSSWVWMHLGGVHGVYKQLRQEGLEEFVLVMPDDGAYFAGSAYLPLKDANYEKWIVEDVLEAVISNCECVSQQSRQFISGLSMGGYGALRLGAKYADRFTAVSAHSSITKTQELSLFVNEDLDIYALGDDAHANEADILYWLKQNRYQLPPLRFDCGKEDLLYEGNLQFKTLLENEGIDFHFEEHSGGHEWPYWNTHIADTFRFFSDIYKTLGLK